MRPAQRLCFLLRLSQGGHKEYNKQRMVSLHQVYLCHSIVISLFRDDLRLPGIVCVDEMCVCADCILDEFRVRS